MSVTFNRKGVMRMKKGFFIVFFLLASVFVFADELTGFDDIDFGTHENKVIALMESKGYKASYPTRFCVSFSKDNETFLEAKVKEYRFYFNSSDNTFISYTMILDKSNITSPFKEAPLFIQKKYNSDDVSIINNKAFFCCKISLNGSEAAIVLLDVYTNEYVINFYSNSYFLDLEIL